MVASTGAQSFLGFFFLLVLAYREVGVYWGLGVSGGRWILLRHCLVWQGILRTRKLADADRVAFDGQ